MILKDYSYRQEDKYACVLTLRALIRLGFKIRWNRMFLEIMQYSVYLGQDGKDHILVCMPEIVPDMPGQLKMETILQNNIAKEVDTNNLNFLV